MSAVCYYNIYVYCICYHRPKRDSHSCFPLASRVSSRSTVPGFVDEYVLSLSEAIGFDVETLSYTLGLFLCYPLGLILNMMPFGKLRHFFSFLLGAFLLQFTIGVQWIHHLITSLACYAMFVVVPRNKVQVLVPAFVMIYMTLGHLHRQYINYLGWDLDFTGAQMVRLNIRTWDYAGPSRIWNC